MKCCEYHVDKEAVYLGSFNTNITFTRVLDGTTYRWPKLYYLCGECGETIKSSENENKVLYSLINELL